MATEFRLSYTGSEINEKLGKIDILEAELNNLSGGNADYVGVEPADDDIPKVFLSGDEFSNMTLAKNEVKMTLEYVSKSDRFTAWIKIKFQGSSSLSYDKKNFTIKMYTDDTYEAKLKKSFKDWNHNGNKYVLKANYIDHSHARNIVSARLWNEVVTSRPDYNNLPVEMRSSPKNGAVDGFPVKLYVNGTYQGIYTWNIGKDDWMWNMDEDNTNHILLCGETNTNGTYAENACNFRALWSGGDGSNWSVEVGTNSVDLKNSLNNLIKFVMDNDGDDFREGIGDYLDIQSAIDYYLFMYVQCGLDGLAKNMLLATYDLTKWICGAYDMDSTWGLYWTGGKFVSPEYRCPEDYMEQFNLLWERIETNYMEELKARYTELRGGVLSYANIVTHFERFMDIIGLDLYAEDLTIYSSIPCGNTNNIQQIRNFVRDRLVYVDSEIGAMVRPVPCTGITLSESNLSFTEFVPQTIIATVVPTNTTDVIHWATSDNNVAIVENGVVTPIADGSCTITAICGNYSSNCSVVVDGQIVCTGIVIDKETMSFTSMDTKTIIATVTPVNTTDVVVWTSDNTEVAIVEDGIVTPVANGSANITATCGEYSAVCVVTVAFKESATFKNGVYTMNGAADKGTVTVTNGNTVRVDMEHLAMVKQFNLSDITKGTVTNNLDKIFTFKTGDVVTTTMTISEDTTFTGGSSIFIRKANTSTNMDILPTSAKAVDNVRTKTITITEDVDVGAICLYIGNPNGATVYEFTISITVNGNEYVIPNS